MSGIFDDVLGLKHVARAGWKRVDINSPESVAAHSWGVAWLVMNLSPEDVDTEHALKLALIHDLPEVIAGDITPHDGISKADKRALEASAARELFADKPHLTLLWKEYEAGETAEAKFVKECDALDMALQAIRYGRMTQAKTDEFIASARKKIRTPALLELLEQNIRR